MMRGPATRVRAAIRVSVLVVLATSTVVAGDAHETGARAMQHAAAGEFDAAVRLLRAALRESDDRAERAVVLFHLGHVLDRRASSDPDGAADHRRGAAAAYRRVLDLYPKSGQAAQNLALVLLESEEDEAGEEAAPLLDALAGRGEGARYDGGSAAKVWIALGDRAAREDRTDEAFSAYARAASADPGDRVAHERLLDQYERGSAPWTPEGMLHYCERLVAEELRPLAVRGYTALIRKTHRAAPDVAERALLRWTEERLALGTLTPDALAALPATEAWKATALEELRGIVAGDADRSTLVWWREEDARAHVAASVLARRAAEAVVQRRDPERAQALYERALELAPEPGAYGAPELRKKDPARLEAAIDYAQLLLAEPHLDPDEERFRSLVGGLFDEKMLSYADRDLQSIRRYHVTLGSILSDREAWVDTAISQLRLAVRTEESLAREEEREARAEPALHLMLADRLAAAGRDHEAFDETIEAAKDAILLRDPEKLEAARSHARRLAEGMPEARRADYEQRIDRIDRVEKARRDSIRRADRLDIPRDDDGVERFEASVVGPLEREARAVDARWAARLTATTYSEMEAGALRLGDAEAADRYRERASRTREAGGLRPRGTIDPGLSRELERLRGGGRPRPHRGGGR